MFLYLIILLTWLSKVLQASNYCFKCVVRCYISHSSALLLFRTSNNKFETFQRKNYFVSINEYPLQLFRPLFRWVCLYLAIQPFHNQAKLKKSYFYPNLKLGVLLISWSLFISLQFIFSKAVDGKIKTWLYNMYVFKWGISSKCVYI